MSLSAAVILHAHVPLFDPCVVWQTPPTEDPWLSADGECFSHDPRVELTHSSNCSDYTNTSFVKGQMVPTSECVLWTLCTQAVWCLLYSVVTFLWILHHPVWPQYSYIAFPLWYHDYQLYSCNSDVTSSFLYITSGVCACARVCYVSAYVRMCMGGSVALCLCTCVVFVSCSSHAVQFDGNGANLPAVQCCSSVWGVQHRCAVGGCGCYTGCCMGCTAQVWVLYRVYNYCYVLYLHTSV